MQSIFRHGDRSPVYNAFEGSPEKEQIQTYKNYWEEQKGIPKAKYKDQFPVRSHNSRTFDAHAMPWGVLSRYGLYQATERGRRLGQRYANLLKDKWIQSSPRLLENLRNSSHHPQHSHHTHHHHNNHHDQNLIEAYSSNFIRTQLSCSAVMEGLLQQYGQSLHTYPQLHSQWIPPVIPITIAPSNVCPIGVFDSGNGIMAHARKVFASPIVRNREIELKKYSDTLIHAIPYFQIPPTSYSTASVNTSSSSSSSSTSSATKTTTIPATPINFVADTGDKLTRFLWIRAFDFLHTSSQHTLKVVPPTIQNYEYIAGKHLTWRFRTLFSHHEILALASRNLLNIILSNIEEDIKKIQAVRSAAASPTSTHHFPAIRLFSGHDVTLMPLLYSMSLDAPHSVIKVGYPSGNEVELTDAEMINACVPWPNYSSALSFELYEIENTGDYSIEWIFENDRLPQGENLPIPPNAMKDEEILYMKGTLTVPKLRKMTDYIEQLCPREL